MKPAACGIGMLHWSRSRVRESLLKREAPKHGASVFYSDRNATEL